MAIKAFQWGVVWRRRQFQWSVFRSGLHGAAEAFIFCIAPPPHREFHWTHRRAVGGVSYTSKQRRAIQEERWQANFDRLAQQVQEQQRRRRQQLENGANQQQSMCENRVGSSSSSALRSSASVGANQISPPASPPPRIDSKLLRWLDRQRRYLRNRLDGYSGSVGGRDLPHAVVRDRADKLASIGYGVEMKADGGPSTSESPKRRRQGRKAADWDERFRQLQMFVSAKEGRFPYDFTKEELALSSRDDLRLLWWCRSQRRQYKLMKNMMAHCEQPEGKQQQEQSISSGEGDEHVPSGGITNARTSVALTPERVAQLESIGFELDPFEQVWHRRYRELVEFHRVHGHCRVPMKAQYAANPALAVWVGEQRYHYKKWIEGRPHSITGERMRLLDAIGFDWNVFDAQWLDKYERLREHVRINGAANSAGRVIPRHDKELLNWIRHQLKLFRAKRGGAVNSLTDDRENKLKALGFPWRQSSSRHPSSRSKQ